MPQWCKIGVYTHNINAFLTAIFGADTAKTNTIRKNATKSYIRRIAYRRRLLRTAEVQKKRLIYNPKRKQIEIDQNCVPFNYYITFLCRNKAYFKINRLDLQRICHFKNYKSYIKRNNHHNGQNNTQTNRYKLHENPVCDSKRQNVAKYCVFAILTEYPYGKNQCGGKTMIEINVNDTSAKATLIKQLAKNIRQMVVVCIGTENVVADSLGPRVGSLLNENLSMPLFVYGMQGTNIDAKNLSQAVSVIKRLHPNSPLLVVDAAVGTDCQVGKVQLTTGGIVPGAATNKQLENVGDVSIVGIVSNKDMADFYENSVEKSLLVEKLSQFIATTIVMATKCAV